MGWHLSFDPATKTFAFSLVHIRERHRLAEIAGELQGLAGAVLECVGEIKKARESGDIALARRALADCRARVERRLRELSDEVKTFIVVHEGRTADLFPGVADAEIKTVERIQKLTEYLEETVKPAVVKIVGGLDGVEIDVEYQSINATTRMIAAAIIARFPKNRACLVGPSLKNGLCFGPGGEYGNFATTRAYTSNKKHSLHNFVLLEKIFTSHVPPMSASLRGHIADSVMQVVGKFVSGSPCDKF